MSGVNKRYKQQFSKSRTGEIIHTHDAKLTDSSIHRVRDMRPLWIRILQILENDEFIFKKYGFKVVKIR